MPFPNTEVKICDPEGNTQDIGEIGELVTRGPQMMKGYYKREQETHNVLEGISLGSANWDKWSLSINKELNLATSHPPAVDELIERVFEKDFAASPELTEPFPERWSDFLLEFLGDYIF